LVVVLGQATLALVIFGGVFCFVWVGGGESC
jgi:hypothetical protein